MRTGVVEERLAASDELLSTGEVAAILGTSRQHVVDLCERGDLPYLSTGTHRRIRRSDVEALRSRTERLTRDQRRSLWLGYATAGKVVADPNGTLAVARRNLARLMEANPRGGVARRLEEWERILDGPVSGVLDALTSPSPRARELRQNTPFAGVLSQDERLAILEAFVAADRSSR
jgi:excisionase family DNA binding protein